jgi:SAM-dependent methyltransferase
LKQPIITWAPERSAPILALVSVVKSILPASLQPLARKFWHGVVRLRRRMSLKLEYLSLKLRLALGDSYLKWYANRLDSMAQAQLDRYRKGEYEEKDRVWLEESGVEDLAIMKQLGLEPQHSLFEFGCGYLRSGFHFIGYLEPGNYVGNDASAVRVEIGREGLAKLNLLDKNPTLTANTDNSMDWANGRKFDFIWSHAVVAHVPPEDLEEIVGNMSKLMHESSVAYVSCLDVYDLKNDVERDDAKNWRYSLAFFQNRLAKYGLVCEDASEDMKGIVTQSPWSPYDKLLRITLKAG